MADPKWLVWAREIQATAQTGLAFSKDPYDIDRFKGLSALAARIVAEHAGIPVEPVRALFDGEVGYATPKVGVRGAVFDPQGRILMVREAIDNDRWTLPGGWADINQTPAQSVEREIREESGYLARAVKLAAVWDRARQHQPAMAFSIIRMFYICELQGGAPATSLETSGTGWFGEHEIPADLSPRRTTHAQVARMFAHRRDPGLPTEFD